MILFLLAAAGLFFAANFAVNQFVWIDRVTVPVRGLCEAFEGFTILHLSDLKGARFGGGQSLIGFSLGDAEFDMVAITGDMISPMGNANPFYELLAELKEKNPHAPVYYIAGDGDPLPVSMNHAPGGSPFAPWVLGAQQRGATLLDSPVCIERDGQKIWLMTRAQQSLDINTMQGQYEQQYLAALAGGDENEIEMTAYQLSTLEKTRAARRQMTAQDAYITLTHALPDGADTAALRPAALPRPVDLMLGGHYLGGMLRLPFVGPLFIPSSELPNYGLMPEEDIYSGLTKREATWLYANAGLGARDGMYPAWFFRVMNPPVAALISLTPSAL